MRERPKRLRELRILRFVDARAASKASTPESSPAYGNEMYPIGAQETEHPDAASQDTSSC
jgi:hypothetical protein